MKNMTFILCSLFLTACKTVPTVKYSPPLNGQKDPNGLVSAGEPLKPIDVNWYAVLFYASLVLWAVWFYFRNEGGEDMDHDGMQDSIETTETINNTTEKKNDT